MMDQKFVEINFFADESGQLHVNSQKRYFVIGGYYCLKSDSQLIALYFKRALKRIKMKRKMIKSEELKTRDMEQEEKIKLLKVLQESEGFKGFAIVIDKSRLKRKISKESIFYNYFIKQLLNDVIIPDLNFIYPKDEIYIEMYLDNRNTSIEHLKGLEDYLNSDFAMSNFHFSTLYRNSSHDFRIQASDLIANTIYMYFKDKTIISEVIPHIDPHKIFVTCFPGFCRYLSFR